MDFILVGILGLLAGSLVNLLADDLPYRRQPGIPAYPDGTRRPLIAWSGLLAFLANMRSPQHPAPDPQRARPHTESSQLSWRYPLAELLTIFLMILGFAATRDLPGMDWLQLLLILLYMGIFSLIVVIDVEHKLILFVTIIPAILIGLFDSIVTSAFGPNLQNALLGAAFGFGVFFLMYMGGFLFNRVVGKMRGQVITTTAFGYGDVMLITFSGVLLGFAHVFFALFITVFLGAGGAIVYLIAKRVLSGKYNAFTAIPYGPYIVAGTIIMLLYGPQVQYMIWGW